MYKLYTITVPQEDVIATQYQAGSLVESIAGHLEPLVKDVAVRVIFILNDVAVQVESAAFDISVQTEPLVNDCAVQVDFKFSEKVQAKSRQSMLMNAMAVHNSCKKMASF